MITTTLQDQLKYVERCQNPNYIILLRNKAGDNMDFSQLKIIGLDDKPQLLKKRYEIKVLQKDEGKFTIVVIDLTNNSETARVNCVERNKQRWLENLNKQYSRIKL